MSDIDMDNYDSEYFSNNNTAFTTNKKIKFFNPYNSSNSLNNKI